LYKLNKLHSDYWGTVTFTGGPEHLAHATNA